MAKEFSLPGKFQLWKINFFTAQSLRLLFVDARMDSEQLTEDALNVCKLLAIDPKDVVHRDKSEFS